MTLEAGVIALIPFPFSDLSSFKRRPVLVLRGPDNAGDFICLAITSKGHHAFGVPISSQDLVEGEITAGELDPGGQGVHACRRAGGSLRGPGATRRARTCVDAPVCRRQGAALNASWQGFCSARFGKQCQGAGLAARTGIR